MLYTISRLQGCTTEGPAEGYRENQGHFLVSSLHEYALEIVLEGVCEHQKSFTNTKAYDLGNHERRG